MNTIIGLRVQSAVNSTLTTDYDFNAVSYRKGLRCLSQDCCPTVSCFFFFSLGRFSMDKYSHGSLKITIWNLDLFFNTAFVPFLHLSDLSVAAFMRIYSILLRPSVLTTMS